MMMTYLGNGLIFCGIVFIGLGVFGMFRYKHFYARILVASNIDTVGFLTVLIGVMVREGAGFFSLKVMLILFVTLLINPMTTHSIARSAYLSGYKVHKEE